MRAVKKRAAVASVRHFYGADIEDCWTAGLLDCMDASRASVTVWKVYKLFLLIV